MKKRTSVIKSYVALLLVIVLWVSVWAISDTLGSMYLKDKKIKLLYYIGFAMISSAILLIFFPNDLWL